MPALPTPPSSPSPTWTWSPGGRARPAGQAWNLLRLNICCELRRDPASCWRCPRSLGRWRHHAHTPGVPRTAGSRWLGPPLWPEGFCVGPAPHPWKMLWSHLTKRITMQLLLPDRKPNKRMTTDMKPKHMSDDNSCDGLRFLC